MRITGGERCWCWLHQSNKEQLGELIAKPIEFSQNCRIRAIVVWQPDFLDIKVTKKDWSWEPGHCKFVHLDVLPPQHAMLIPGLDW